MLDGAPDAVKVACPVLAGGKSGDNIKGLPIGTTGISRLPLAICPAKSFILFTGSNMCFHK